MARPNARFWLLAVLLGTVAAATSPAHATSPDMPSALALGTTAPDFTLTDTTGTSVQLSSFRGSVVVLEWFNADCPFIVSAHGDGPLRTLPAEAEKQGVVWLTINSSAEGKQGHGVARNTRAKDEYALPRAVLLDSTGDVGRLYGAKTTPHLYIVDKDGQLVYRGGLDNAPRGDVPAGGLQAFFQNALDNVRSGKPVSPADTKAYGCSVKY